MAARMSEIPKLVYQIKVTLLDSKPPIWRRLLLPAGLTLAQLHDVLQAAMGWQDCHLHGFEIGNMRFGPQDAFTDMGTEDERKVRLYQVLGRKGAKADYTYDFGDGWEHRIVVEKTLPEDPEVAYPICIGGKRNCPPEDCGGVWGYAELLNTINDPEHEQHEEMMEWIGGEFDPEHFSVDDVNSALAALRGHRRAVGSA